MSAATCSHPAYPAMLRHARERGGTAAADVQRFDVPTLGAMDPRALFLWVVRPDLTWLIARDDVRAYKRGLIQTPAPPDPGTFAQKLRATGSQCFLWDGWKLRPVTDLKLAAAILDKW